MKNFTKAQIENIKRIEKSTIIVETIRLIQPNLNIKYDSKADEILISDKLFLNRNEYFSLADNKPDLIKNKLEEKLKTFLYTQTK